MSRVTAYRLLAYSTSVFAFCTFFAASFALPFIYGYVHSVTKSLRQEFSYCKLTAKELLEGVKELQVIATSGNRTTREAKLDNIRKIFKGPLDLEVESSSQCNDCCLPGPPGSPGFPGIPGKPGRHGSHGMPGNPGKRMHPPCFQHVQVCGKCPRGPKGEPGLQGPPGDDGRDGRNGMNGKDGKPGISGTKGLSGMDGRDGLPGITGEPGDPCASSIEYGPAGQEGLPGRDGAPGKPGRNGQPGRDGLAGQKGYPGLDGVAGFDGTPGAQGPPGKPGKAGFIGICPKYCAIDGGIFFEDGMKMQRKM